jgi:hypothetical protein
MTTPKDDQPRCECGEPITEFVWLVRGVFLCSQRCGARAADRAAFAAVDVQPQSRACYARM